MGWAISAGSDIHIHLEHGWGINSSVPPGLCRHSLHECLERALSSLPGSAFIKSLSVHFSLSRLLRFPPGMCFDFSAIPKSSGFAWKVIYPRLCFSVYVHVLQCTGGKHKEQWAVLGLPLMEELFPGAGSSL